MRSRNYDRSLAVSLAVEPRLDCYECGHAYDHLGKGVHPGVCPACASWAVSPAGDLSVRDERVEQAFTGHEMLSVYAEDESDRYWKFQFRVDVAPEGDGRLARLSFVRIENATFNADHPRWNSTALLDVADAVVSESEEYDDLRLVRSDSEDW